MMTLPIWCSLPTPSKTYSEIRICQYYIRLSVALSCQLLILQRQPDVVLRDRLPAGARAQQIIELGDLDVALELRVRRKSVQQRGHVPGITHHLPDTAQTGV